MTYDEYKSEWSKELWAEYTMAAEWCAKHGLNGKLGDPLPANLSPPTLAEINYDTEAFQEHVRECAYAKAMNEHLPNADQ